VGRDPSAMIKLRWGAAGNAVPPILVARALLYYGIITRLPGPPQLAKPETFRAAYALAWRRGLAATTPHQLILSISCERPAREQDAAQAATPIRHAPQHEQGGTATASRRARTEARNEPRASEQHHANTINLTAGSTGCAVQTLGLPQRGNTCWWASLVQLCVRCGLPVPDTANTLRQALLTGDITIVTAAWAQFLQKNTQWGKGRCSAPRALGLRCRLPRITTGPCGPKRGDHLLNRVRHTIHVCPTRNASAHAPLDKAAHAAHQNRSSDKK
jgi:hypothetical protein